MNAESHYQALITLAQHDPTLRGLILGGSRGKGFTTAYSDYDVVLIVHEGTRQDYHDRLVREYPPEAGIDLEILSLDQFRAFANWDSSEEHWRRYNYAHLRAVVDPMGDIQHLIEKIITIPPAKIFTIVSETLDEYINWYHRSLKNHRDGYLLGSRLDAAFSLNPLIRLLFAVEGRMWPYNKYVEWELRTYPLQHLPWTPEEFVVQLDRICSTGEVATQISVFRRIEETFRGHGYGHVFEGWKGHYLG
jgi:hypothetical protein